MGSGPVSACLCGIQWQLSPKDSMLMIVDASALSALGIVLPVFFCAYDPRHDIQIAHGDVD